MLRLCSTVLNPPMLLIVILALGCGGGGADGGTPPPTTTIAKTSSNSGDAQNGTVGQLLGAPLQVVVTEGGAPSAGLTVTWSTPATGGSLDPTSTPTDANGVASSDWTLGTVASGQTAQAALTGATGSPVGFSAAAAPDVATRLSNAGGDGQTGMINTKLAGLLQAKVSDQFGNGIAGVAVTWGASGATPSATTVPTNASGISPVQVTLGGAAGLVTITATTDVLAGTSLTFNATAEPVPTAAGVQVRNILFSSNRNGTQNPAVDTIAVGGTVTWTWTNTGGTSHSVQSQGPPSFTSSAIQSSGTHTATFNAAGTYQYDCAVHGALMTGQIFVR